MLILGLLYDLTGNYDLSFYVIGSVIALSGIISFPLKHINNWEKSAEAKKRNRIKEGELQMELS